MFLTSHRFNAKRYAP